MELDRNVVRLCRFGTARILTLGRLGGLHEGVRGPRILATEGLGGLGKRYRLRHGLQARDDISVDPISSRTCLAYLGGETLRDLALDGDFGKVVEQGEPLYSRLCQTIGLDFMGFSGLGIDRSNSTGCE